MGFGGIRGFASRLFSSSLGKTNAGSGDFFSRSFLGDDLNESSGTDTPASPSNHDNSGFDAVFRGNLQISNVVSTPEAQYLELNKKIDVCLAKLEASTMDKSELDALRVPINKIRDPDIKLSLKDKLEVLDFSLDGLESLVESFAHPHSTEVPGFQNLDNGNIGA